MDYKYNFSIIIPHKNIPDLLKRCVLSIPRRDDVQIIIVDDNSDEDKVDFEHFPFLEDTNIRIIFDKTGFGAGHARNVGLQCAEGEWLIFADSDDFFFYSLNSALEICLHSKSDIIYYKSTNLDSDTYQFIGNRSSITNNSVSRFLKKEKDGEHLIRMRHPAPWGKIIRSSLVFKHSIQFEEIPKANDYKFSYLCGYYARFVEAYDISIYCLTSRSDNLTSVSIPGLDFIVAKSEIGYLKFLCEHSLQHTSTYKEFQNDVFSKICNLQRTDLEEYKILCQNLRNNGFSEDYIYSNIRRIKYVKKRINILKNICCFFDLFRLYKHF